MEDDTSSLSRSMFTFHNNDSNTSLSNLLLPDNSKIPSMQDYLDVSIDLNSVFELNNTVNSTADDPSGNILQQRSLTTPTVMENENLGLVQILFYKIF